MVKWCGRYIQMEICSGGGGDVEIYGGDESVWGVFN